MHSSLTRSLDRWVIRQAARAMPRPGRHASHAEEAAALLQHPDFFCDFVKPPGDFQFVDENAFQFRSPIVTPWEKNNLVRGKLFVCAKEWQDRPSVILLHGWNDELGYQFRFPYLAKLLNQRGVNVVYLELPYHLQRRPGTPGAINNFISEDLWRMIEATRQSIADVRSVVKWLHSLGSGKIGVWGSSLGAWLTGLIACHEPELDFAILTTPVAKLERVINELEFCAPIRHSYEKNPISLARLNLETHRPKSRRENILIHEAVDDLFAPKEAIEEVWRAWNEPEIWRLRHGHISVLLSVPVMKRTVTWVAEKFSGAA